MRYQERHQIINALAETEPDRFQKTLFEVLKRRIKPGFNIMSDVWKSYDRLEDNKFGLLIWIKFQIDVFNQLSLEINHKYRLI